MTNKDIYKIWAPYNKKWVDWVRPVPFIHIDSKTRASRPINIMLPYIQNLNANSVDKTTAIIVDMPGTNSMYVGISLAQRGYRPIPIYNGIVQQNGSRAIVDNCSIANDLVWGASILKDIDIPNNAPPAFLTDTNRLQKRRISESIFDNSWDVYHQDLPTEDYFLQNGITQILVISQNSISMDLQKIFTDYPKRKLKILWTNGYEEPKCIWKGKK